MTGQELVDYIEMYDLGDWEFEAKYHGEIFDVVDAVRVDGKIRLYPNEEEEG